MTGDESIVLRREAEDRTKYGVLLVLFWGLSVNGGGGSSLGSRFYEFEIQHKISPKRKRKHPGRGNGPLLAK